MWEAEIDSFFQSFVSANVELLFQIAHGMKQQHNDELEQLAHRNLGYALSLLQPYASVSNRHLTASADVIRQLRDHSWTTWLQNASAPDVLKVFQSKVTICGDSS